MLFGLTNAARVQTLHVLSYKQLKKLSSGYRLWFNSLLKQSRPGFDQNSLILRAYPPDRRLCVVIVLKEYLLRTSHVERINQMTIYSLVTSNHISR